MTVAGYSGDAGNALMTTLWPNWIASGRMFSTRDSDNDVHTTGSCAGNGGWWFGACSTSAINKNLNGIWVTGPAVNNVQASRMLVKLN